LMGGLPAEFPGSIFVVVHFPGSVTSTLPRTLSRAGPLPAHHPKDGESIEPGRIYVAPPDCHLLLFNTEQAMDTEHHASVIRNVLNSGIRIDSGAEVAAVG
jgi:chemotaxis response regulator CheB